MLIKKSKLAEICNLFNDIKLNKISNSNIRKTILKIILEGKRISASLQEDIETTRNKFFSEFSDADLDAFQKLLNEARVLYTKGNNTEFVEKTSEMVKNYPEINEAFNKFNIELQSLQDEETNINVDEIEIDDFVEAMSGQDIDITAKYLDSISPIFKNGSEN